jgi:hypothetical protein
MMLTVDRRSASCCCTLGLSACLLLLLSTIPMLMVCLHACNTSPCCALKLLLSVISYGVMQPDEYEKLGSYALIGLPEGDYKTK